MSSRQSAVERLRGTLRRRTSVDIDGNDICEGVHAGVRAPGDRDVAELGERRRERGAESTLDRRVIGLRRPAAVPGAVVLDR